MSTAYDRLRNIIEATRTSNGFSCLRILSARATILEEMRDGPPAPYTRTYFRAPAPERLPVQIAVLGASRIDRGLESELRRLRLDGVALRDPSESRVEELTDFRLAPEWVRWVMPLPKSVDDWIGRIAASAARSQLRRDLRACESIRTEVCPLTLGDYHKWYESLYVPEVLSKPGALPVWSDVNRFAESNHIAVGESTPDTCVPGFLRIFMYDDSDALIGGVMVSVDEDTRTLRARGGALDARTRSKRELAVKSMAALVNEGNRRGFHTLSYGDDSNLFGMDAALGLALFKASIGMHPIPSPLGRFQLLKLFDDTFTRLRSDTPGPYPGLLTFGVAAKGAARIAAYRSLRSIAHSGSPYAKKVEVMLANSAGIQWGADAGAAPMDLPKGMPLVRVDLDASAQ